jgi:hypothetical protein
LEFVVDKVALGQFFSEYFGRFIPPLLHKIEKQKNSSSSSQVCTISFQGCGGSVASAAGPVNKKRKSLHAPGNLGNFAARL